MTAAEERVSNQSLQRQIIELTGRVNQVACGIDDIKNMLKHMEERIRKLENNEAGTRPLIESKIDAAWRKIDEHDARIQTVETAINTILLSIEGLKQPIKIATWVAVVVGGVIITWIVSRWLMP